MRAFTSECLTNVSLGSKTITFLNGKRAYSNGHRSRTRVPPHLIIYSSSTKNPPIRTGPPVLNVHSDRSNRRTGVELSARPIGERLIRVHRRDKTESTRYKPRFINFRTVACDAIRREATANSRTSSDYNPGRRNFTLPHPLPRDSPCK